MAVGGRPDRGLTRSRTPRLRGQTHPSAKGTTTWMVLASTLLLLLPTAVRAQDLYLTSPVSPDWTSLHTLLPLVFFCCTFPLYLTSAVLLWRRRSKYPIAGRGSFYLMATNGVLLFTAPLATVASLVYPGGVPCGLVFLIASTSVLPLSFTYMARGWILVFRLEIQNYIADLHLAESELAARREEHSPVVHLRRIHARGDHHSSGNPTEAGSGLAKPQRTIATVTSMATTTTTTTVTTMPTRGQASATLRPDQSPMVHALTERQRSGGEVSRATRAESLDEEVEMIYLDPRKASIFRQASTSSSRDTHHQRHSFDVAAAEGTSPAHSERSNPISTQAAARTTAAAGISPIAEEASGRRSPWTKTSSVPEVAAKYQCEDETSKKDSRTAPLPAAAAPGTGSSTIIHPSVSSGRTTVEDRIDVARIRGHWFVQHRRLIEARWLGAFFGGLSALFFFVVVMAFLVSDDPDIEQVNRLMVDAGVTTNPHYYTRSQLHPRELLYAAPCQLSTGKMLFVQFSIVGLLTPLVVWIVLRLRKNARRSARRARYLAARGLEGGPTHAITASTVGGGPSHGGGLGHLRASYPNDTDAVKMELGWIAGVALYIIVAYPLLSLFAKPYILFDVLVPLAAIELITLAHPLYIAWRLARGHRRFLVAQRLYSLKGGAGYTKLAHHRPYYRLKFILRTAHTYPALLAFLRKEHSSENALFIKDVREFETHCKELESKLSTWPKIGGDDGEAEGHAVHPTIQNGTVARTLVFASTKGGVGGRPIQNHTTTMTAAAAAGVRSVPAGNFHLGGGIVTTVAPTPTAASRTGRPLPRSPQVAPVSVHLNAPVSLPGSVVRSGARGTSDEHEGELLAAEEEGPTGRHPHMRVHIEEDVLLAQLRTTSAGTSEMSLEDLDVPPSAITSTVTSPTHGSVMLHSPSYGPSLVPSPTAASSYVAGDSSIAMHFPSATLSPPTTNTMRTMMGASKTASESTPSVSNSPMLGSQSAAHRMHRAGPGTSMVRGKDTEDNLSPSGGRRPVPTASPLQSSSPTRPGMLTGHTQKAVGTSPIVLSPSRLPSESPKSVAHRSQLSVGSMPIGVWANVTSTKIGRHMFSLGELRAMHEEARAIKARCLAIHEQYLRPSAPLEINISDDLVQLIAAQVDSIRDWQPSPLNADGTTVAAITKESKLPNPPPFALSTLYRQASMTIFDLIQKDSFRRFVLTDAFLDLLTIGDELELRKQQAQESLEAQTRAAITEAVFSIRVRAVEQGLPDDGLGHKTDGTHALDEPAAHAGHPMHEESGSTNSRAGVDDEQLDPESIGHSRKSHRRSSIRRAHQHVSLLSRSGGMHRRVSPAMDAVTLFLEAPPLAGAELNCNPMAVAASHRGSAPSSAPSSLPGSKRGSLMKTSPLTSAKPSPALSSHPSPGGMPASANRSRISAAHPQRQQLYDSDSDGAAAADSKARRAPPTVSIGVEGEWAAPPSSVEPEVSSPGPLYASAASAASPTSAESSSGGSFSPKMAGATRATSLRRALTGKYAPSVDLTPLVGSAGVTRREIDDDLPTEII